MIPDADRLVAEIRSIHKKLCEIITDACENTVIKELSRVVEDDIGDTIFVLDRISENHLVELFSPLSDTWSFILIAEGLPEKGLVFPKDISYEAAELIIVVDPIDGTRGLMYQKRSAWILTGIAENNQTQLPTLSDIEISIQTEIPVIKQSLFDCLWAIRGCGAQAERFDRCNGKKYPLPLKPSTAETVAQGFGGIVRFVPGGRDILAKIDDIIYKKLLGLPQPGKAQAFEDQYICTGGQLYELIVGHDRWIADLRPFLQNIGVQHGICAHPYDLCTELVARESGVVITNGVGESLDVPLDITTEVAWVGYANSIIRKQVEPILKETLKELNLIDNIS